MQQTALRRFFRLIQRSPDADVQGLDWGFFSLDWQFDPFEGILELEKALIEFDAE